MFFLYVVFTLVHMRFQQYTIYQGYPLLQNPHADKLSYAGAGSEIDSKGHKYFHWQMNQMV